MKRIVGELISSFALAPINPDNFITPSIFSSRARVRVMPNVILFVILLLLSACASAQIETLPNGTLITKGEMEKIFYASGEECTVTWNHADPDHKYEVRLLYYDMNAEGEFLKKGEAEPEPVSSNEYSFKVKPGITIFSVRTVDAESNKSSWSYSIDRRVAADQKPWIISCPR